LILADWGAKSGQCCRLFSERSTDESFGPNWNGNHKWRVFRSLTRLTYIREADLKTRWVHVLAQKQITPSLVDALIFHGHEPIEDLFLWGIDSAPDDGELWDDELLDDGEPRDNKLLGQLKGEPNPIAKSRKQTLQRRRRKQQSKRDTRLIHKNIDYGMS
jgi:hypothetical protein